MTSSLPPQEPPTQGPIRPIRFFRNLLLGGETKAEVEKQVKNKVEEIIEEDKLEDKLKCKLKTKLNELDEELGDLNSEYKQKHKNKLEEYEKETKEELSKLRERLSELNSQAVTALLFLGAFALILTVSAGPLLSDILSLDVFKANLERLEKDVEVLKEDPQNN